MTTVKVKEILLLILVVEAYRLDRYDNSNRCCPFFSGWVVEAYRLDRYDNKPQPKRNLPVFVVEAYRLDRYDNYTVVIDNPNSTKL